MQIGGITAQYPFRTAAAASASTVAAVPVADDRSPLARSLDALRDASASNTDDLKARAKEKLDAAKKELEFLRRWGFDPEIVARQAGRLARDVGAAAKDFAQALSPGTGFQAPTEGVAEPAAGQIIANETGADAEAGEDDVSFAEKAYRDTMDSVRENKIVSAADRKTLEEFKAVAQEIKALLAEAIRRMREQEKSDQNAISDAQKSGSNLDQAMQGLDALSAGSAPGIAVPISITI